MAETQNSMMDYPNPVISVNLTDVPSSTLMQLDSTSTMIKEEQLINLDSNNTLRTFFRSASLLNTDMESTTDALTEFLGNNNEFILHRFLSDFNGAEIPIDMCELVKIDSIKNPDSRSISEFLPLDCFDQKNPSSIDFISNSVDQSQRPGETMMGPSFTELCPPTPDLLNGELFEIDPSYLGIEFESPLTLNQMNSFDQCTDTPSSCTSNLTQFNFDPQTMMAYEHNPRALSQPTTLVNTPSPSPTVSKRTPVRAARRTSSRLQSRAQIINYNDLLNNDEESCPSPTYSESSSISTRVNKRPLSVNRTAEAKNEGDLSYYLERRRKNNEASKVSRAARKQKFDQMHFRCDELQHLNGELRTKIATLEVVVSMLKGGLINNFRKDHSTTGLF